MEITRSTLPHPKPSIRLWDSNIELTNEEKHLDLGLVLSSLWHWRGRSTLQASYIKPRESLEYFAGSDVPSQKPRISKDISMLYTFDRVCLCCLEQCNKKWGRSGGEISVPSCSPHPRIPLFARVNHSEPLGGAGPSFLESQRECALVVLRHQLFTRKVPRHLEKVNMPRRTTVYKLRRHRTTFIPTAHTSAYCDSVVQVFAHLS